MQTAPRLALLLFAFAIDPAFATEWHVEADGSGDFPTIQAAYDGAVDGDLIILGPGVYRDSQTRAINDWLHPTTTTAIAFMKAGVDLVGSFGSEATFLDGELDHHGLVGQDLGAVEVRGITFIDTRPKGASGLAGLGGAGMIVFRSQPTVEGCVFRRCIAPVFEVDGASGLYIVQGSAAVVRSNLFVDNYGGDIGGALGILQHTGGLVENNTFARNGAGDSGGAAEFNNSILTVRNNIFAFNSAANTGGAILCLGGSLLSASCNLFWENDAPNGEHVLPSCISLGTASNQVDDPLFCNADMDDFTIRPSSPAAPSDPSGCGLRGAFPAICGTVSLDDVSWGQIKALYFGD